ncbi:hypothetical protein QQ045_015733 [Rhodiola kirilowii]
MTKNPRGFQAFPRYPPQETSEPVGNNKGDNVGEKEQHAESKSIGSPSGSSGGSRPNHGIQKPLNPYIKPSGDKCYCCGGQGHRSNVCPTRTTVALLKEREAEEQDEDNGSAENLVSQKLVDHLKLPTDPHERPYALGWVSKDFQIRVTWNCRVPISIRKHYREEVPCNVIDMDIFHVLFGRPWQYDHDVTYRGRDNVMMFTWGKHKIAMAPISSFDRQPSKPSNFLVMTHSEQEFSADVGEAQCFHPVVSKLPRSVGNSVPVKAMAEEIVDVKEAVRAKLEAFCPEENSGSSSSEVEYESIVDGRIQTSPSPTPLPVQSADILIKGGTVVNAHMVEEADVLIRDGKILQIGQELQKKMSIKVTTEIDASGKYVMPGGIDPHTHLQLDSGGMVSQDDFESGQSAAIAGGTTMTMDFVIPTGGSYINGFETYLKYAEKAVTDYAFHAMIVFWNQSAIDGIDFMVEKGINSFKFFQDFDFKITDKEMIEGFRKCKSLGAIAMVHASNGDAVIDAQNRLFELGITGVKAHALSRPPFVEREGVVRAITLARGINVPLYIVHVMGRDAMEEIAYARKLGLRVIGQPVIAGLALNNSWYWHPDFDTAGKYVMSPPISPPGHDKALQAALSGGVLQLVGTDHCPYNTTQRRAGKDDFRKLPSGLNGIEERMHVMWDTMVNSGQIGAKDYVRLTSTECARIFNIYPRKGAIMPGSDADVIILNPDAEFHISAKTHHSKSDVNIFEGMSGKGKVEVTIARGKVVWMNDILSVIPGSGQHIKMPTYGYMYEGIDKEDAAFKASAEYGYTGYLHLPDLSKVYVSNI